MGTGAADSWYHEKESAGLYGVVAAGEPDTAKRALFIKLAATAIPLIPFFVDLSGPTAVYASAGVAARSH